MKQLTIDDCGLTDRFGALGLAGLLGRVQSADPTAGAFGARVTVINDTDETGAFPSRGNPLICAADKSARNGEGEAGVALAIKLHLDFGFAPDLDQLFAREVWAAFRQRLDHPVLRDV